MGLFKSYKSRYAIMIGMCIFFCLVEFVVGQMSNSIALVADSFHMLSDTLSLIVGMVSISFANKVPDKNTTFTFGYSRSSAMGGFVNGVFLMSLIFHILASSIEKILNPTPVNNPKSIFITGGIGLFINIIGFLVFHQNSLGGSDESEEDIKTAHHNYDTTELLSKEETGGTIETHHHGHEHHHHHHHHHHDHDHHHGELNMKGVLLHIIGDAIGSVFVLVTTGLMVYFKDSKWVLYLDPAMSLVLVCIMTYTTVPLIKQTTDILINVNGDEKKRQIENALLIFTKRYNGTFENFDVIQLSESEFTGSCCFKYDNPSSPVYFKEDIKKVFHKFQVDNVFLQTCCVTRSPVQMERHAMAIPPFP